MIVQKQSTEHLLIPQARQVPPLQLPHLQRLIVHLKPHLSPEIQAHELG
jgi:hypothetical protein